MQMRAYSFKKSLTWGLLVICLSSLPSISMAVLQDEIQVYDDEINAKGEASVELHLNSTPRGIQTPSYPGEVMSNNGVRVTPEFAYGLGHDLEAGLYISYVGYDNKFQYAATKLRLKWLPIREDKGDDFFAGVNLELANVQPQFDESRYNGELRFIIGKHFDEWLFSFNPIVCLRLLSSLLVVLFLEHHHSSVHIGDTVPFRLFRDIFSLFCFRGKACIFFPPKCQLQLH